MSHAHMKTNKKPEWTEADQHTVGNALVVMLLCMVLKKTEPFLAIMEVLFGFVVVLCMLKWTLCKPVMRLLEWRVERKQRKYIERVARRALADEGLAADKGQYYQLEGLLEALRVVSQERNHIVYNILTRRAGVGVQYAKNSDHRDLTVFTYWPTLPEALVGEIKRWAENDIGEALDAEADTKPDIMSGEPDDS